MTDTRSNDFPREYDVPVEPLNTTLMRLPARKRLDAILEREDAEETVGALAAEDFYFTVQELGPDDSVPLLALGTVEQLDFLFDLTWWNRESVHPSRSIEWLDRLGRASDEKFVAWLHEADFTLLVRLFKAWITVSVTPDDVDPLEAIETLPKNTLDDLYYWECGYPQYEDLIKRVLSLLFELNHDFYRELLDHVMWALDAEMEEEAYRLHRGRLEEHAIPDYYEALSVYADPPQVERPRLRRSAVEMETGSFPAFALAVIPRGDLLHRVLMSGSVSASVDELGVELAALANKIVVADQLPPENPESLKFAAGKAMATLNLGLELLSLGDESLAARFVLDSYAEDLFRVGHAELARIRNRLERVRGKGWLSARPGAAVALDGGWAEIAEGLLLKTPMFPEQAVPFVGSMPRGFIRDRRGLSEANAIVEMFEAVAMVGKTLDFDLDTLASEAWEGGQVHEPEEMTPGVLVFTAAASSILGRGWLVEAVPLGDWANSYRFLRPESVRSTLMAYLEGVFRDSERRVLVLKYFEPILAEYTDETAAFNASEAPDPAMVRFFIFRER